MIKVTVIVLVYKAEAYMERCARSLFEQTLQEIEYIFVDDCTPDSSMEILIRTLDDYPERKPNVKIVENDKNCGTGISRNKGLIAYSGEYVIYCDSDDYVEKDMYETLYTKARSDDADIVMCDYIECHEGKGKYCSQNPFICKEDIVTQFLMGRILTCVWGGLVRKRLYTKNQIEFPTGISMWEDMVASVKLYLYAEKVVYIDKALYHYVMNSNSLVHKETMRNVEDRMQAVNEIKNFFSCEGFLIRHEIPLSCLMLESKMNLLLDSSLYDPIRWRGLFPEANRYVWSYHGSSFRKVVMWLTIWKLDNIAKGLLKVKRVIKGWKVVFSLYTVHWLPQKV